MSRAELQPDRAQIEQFFRITLKHADEGTYVSLRSFEHGAGTRPFAIKAVQVNGNLGQLVDVAFGMARAAAKARQGVVLAPPVATFSNAGHAAEADLANGTVLSVECDQRPRDGRQTLEGLLDPATVVVASGGEWTSPDSGEVEDKLHLHWVLNEPTRTPEEHAKLKLARKLATLLIGGDPTAVPAVHPLRLPGSWHRKGKPKLCRIIATQEDAELDLDEALDRLEAAAKAAGLSLEKVKANPGGEDRDTAELIRLITTSTEYLAPLVALSARYAGRGMSAKQIEMTLRGFMDAVPDAGRDIKDGKPQPGRWADRVANLGRIARSAVTKYEAKAEAPPKGKPNGEARRGSEKAPAEGEPANEVAYGDDALALSLGHEWADRARHVALWGKWLFWNGWKWELDNKLLHMTLTREFLRRAARRFPPEEADELCDARSVARVIGLARSNREQASSADEWDADPWLLNTPGGIVDLRTGELRPSDPAACCTKSTAVAPAPAGTPTPLWDAFLERIFRHAPELISYTHRVLGYGLTGLTTEHVLIFAWGQGANGKGTLFNTASRLMGDYAAVAPTDMLLVTHSERHPTDMAMLRGARLVTAQELASGKTWDEPKLKSLTGGDPITARFMRQDFFTYEPQFLLVVAGNHKPSLRGVDEAIRRRLQLAPFLQNIPPEERDKDLPEKLKAEWPGILRRMIDGCLEWQRQGLNPPQSVRNASEDYLAGEDLLGQWIADCCEEGRDHSAVRDDLYASWGDGRSATAGLATAVGPSTAASTNGASSRANHMARGSFAASR